ncbi:MAG: hypothetical protein ACRCTD_08725 [Beijerinckiaceae bacterium]
MIDFQKAASAGIITSDQARALSHFFAGELAVPASAVSAKPSFDLAHTLWYAGALLIISAMTWFTTLGFSLMGGGFLAVVGAIYAVVALMIGNHLWTKKDLKIPGGLFITIAVAMVPLIVFGLQDMTGWWNDGVKPGNYKDFHIWIKGGWVPMEIATFAAAYIAIRRYPFGFIAFIAAVALWYFAMDLAQYLAQHEDRSWQLRRKLTMWLGLLTMLFAWFVDVKQRKADYAFWIHLAGVLGFWCGLTFQSSNSDLAKFFYFLINVGLICIALYLNRRVYAVFGTIGIGVYLGDLANRVFRDSLLFPFALTLIGLGVIALGLWYHKNSARLAARFEQMLPEGLKRLRPQPLV